MTAEYQPEHIIGAMLELRDNQRIEKIVSKYIEKKSWSYVIELLQKGRELEIIVQGWDIPLRKGVLRDGMIELLHLHDFMGLDVDFVNTFADLEVKSLDDLRKQSREKAKDLLGEQVKRGLTFFMDLKAMSDTELSILVPDALEARSREVKRLGERPHLYEVYSTYYGFTVLTSKMSSDQTGVPDDIRENLLLLFGEMGGVNDITSKQLKFSPLAFRKCSPDLMILLWNILRLSLGGRKYKINALNKLAELGDSRALHSLHSMVLQPLSSLDCIGTIGHPSSYDYVERLGIVSRLDIPNKRQIPIYEVLGSIRHPAIVQKIQEQMDNLSLLSNPRTILPIITTAANTRLREWIPYYEEMREKRSKIVKRAAEKALSNVHPPFEEEEPV